MTKVEEFVNAVKKYVKNQSKKDLDYSYKLWEALTEDEKLEAEKLSEESLKKSLGTLRATNKFTNEIAASLVHYGQIFGGLQNIDSEEAQIVLEYETKNFNKFMEELGYNPNDAKYGIEVSDDFGIAILVILDRAGKIGDLTLNRQTQTVDTGEELEVHFDTLRALFDELNLDSVEIGIRAKKMSEMSRMILMNEKDTKLLN